MKNKSFAAFILTHGRPRNVKTYAALRKHGYTGKIYIVIDNEDKSESSYRQSFGKEVIMFDKKAMSEKFDTADNFDDRRAIAYARNASFEIAKSLGYEHFIQLDDDYNCFAYRFNDKREYCFRYIKNLDAVFDLMVNFHRATQTHSIAMAQGGDFIGGSESGFAKQITLKRKCMNSFICSTEKPFQFIGRVNEDVNTYTHKTSLGLLLFTFNGVSLQQETTQKTPGGMTDIYLNSGTYVKSFYTIVFQPSSVKIAYMTGGSQKRLHHKVNWNQTAPKILRENLKKGEEYAKE